MPKLNDLHLTDRLKEAIEQLESGIEVEAKKNKTLLNTEQQQALDDAWAKQQLLRKTHKPPKTDEEKQQIGWKDKREVRIEIYKQALAELDDNMLDIYAKQLEKKEQVAAKAFLKGYFGATEGQDKMSAARIAMTQAGFKVTVPSAISKRDREVHKMEDDLRKRFESEMTAEEKEQMEILREHEKYLQMYRKKTGV
ncbi:MAG: hypothetical protein KGN31_07085 [Betaproteobacteria bacterium]|nr:hypothetical protein [Betaproteobacteria bacterium]